jgi:hypothetical protein
MKLYGAKVVSVKKVHFCQLTTIAVLALLAYVFLAGKSAQAVLVARKVVVVVPSPTPGKVVSR